ncbi:MAG: hypothetical protein Q8Q47_07070 [Ignavibacteriaceae bacterium]|nr:hypothetical protein [Ignavibacteriaceae bacterium]
MATWPTTLPPPTSDYGLNPVDPTVRTDMESGAARTRRRTKARNDKVRVAWNMTDAELTIFRAWFDDDATGAAGGAAWFDISLPIGTGGIVSVTAKFVGVYKANYLPGMNWLVSGELEIRQ